MAIHAAPVPSETAHALGECPVWNPNTETVQWVDIDRGELWELRADDRPRLVLNAGSPLGAAMPAEGSGHLSARRSTLVHVSADGSVLREFQVFASTLISRLNDASCDPAGRCLVGSIAEDERVGQELLWRLEETGELTVLDDDLTISNGLGWSPDGGTLYSVDSGPGVVWARRYEPHGRRIGSRHLLVSGNGETPDGLSVDAAGNLWIAFWGAGEVRAYSPAGRVMEVVKTTAPLTTNCAFVGPRLDRLFITSAGKPADGVPAAADSGKCFLADVAAIGQPTTLWRPVFSRRP
jgi:sugar lactone lactonase YvrE